MSAHRRHYFDANGPRFGQVHRGEHVVAPRAERPAPSVLPTAPVRVPFIGSAPLAAALVLFIFGLVALYVLVQRTDAPPAEPEISHAQALADARIEGFRAGMQTATEAGCTPRLALSAPLER